MLPLSDFLRDKGIRPSWQRLAIAKFMLSDRSHPSAEEVYERLCDSNPALSKATIYNTLNLFAEKGVIRTMNQTCVERHYDGILERHGHVICPVCGKIEDFVYDQDDIKAIERIQKKSDADSVELVINRKCNSCKKNNK